MTLSQNDLPATAFSSLPGAEATEASLLKEFEQKLDRMGKAYQPRTHHLTTEGNAKFFNRLFLETSPYLLQHAHNPVNWYSWGDEAFQHAAELKRPVLVSIGYSTCHWCHVMEEESFEDLEIAEYLNQHYICIKVDREERPDVDAIYMTAVQAMTGSGGWPLNVMVTHDRKPFWGGTYLPPRNGDRGATYGFLTILNRIHQVFNDAPQEIEKSCDQLTGAIERFLSPPVGKNLPGIGILDDTIEMFKQAYDPQHGGIQGAPKFPSSLPIRLLMRNYLRTGQSETMEMALHSLRKMAAGGIYDQVGGGFHRYSTDEVWLVPHFEKMLYDNALLAVNYIEAYQLSHEALFRDTAIDILEYVLREMTAETGAFYSATDADSLNENGKQEEGYFFTWTPHELSGTLSQEQYDLVQKVWGVSESGNFEGRNIFHLDKGIEQLSLELQVSLETLQENLQSIRQILYQERSKRHQPLRDDKIIVSWNGLMISAFAIAGDILGEQRFMEAAAKAADFIEKTMIVEGRLYRTWKDQKLNYKAFLSDYSNYTASCLDLFRATQNVKWLNQAQLNDKYLADHFEDTINGGFYMAGDDQEILITREKPASDGALPSGNAIAALNLIRLYWLTLDDSYKKRFDKTISCLLGKETSGMAGHSETLAAFELSQTTPLEVVIVSPNDPDEAIPYRKILQQHFLPQAQVFYLCQNTPDPELIKKVPYLAKRDSINGKTTAYICREGSCQLPITDPDVFERQINGVSIQQKGGSA